LEYRDLGQTGMRVSEISLGTWAFGGDWGTVGEHDAYAALDRAVDLGVNFIDTADVYGDGRSEKLIGRLLKDRPNDGVLVATKAGRRLNPHTSEGYDYENLSAFVERSLNNLGVEALDLLQLHCPPTEVYRQDSTFEALDRLQEAGKVRNYGVSVEKVEEGRMAIDYPNVKTVQIIFNIFRQKPAEEFFPLAENATSASSPEYPSPADCSRARCVRTACLAKTTTATSTARGRPSTRGRRFQAWISRLASWPPKN
jgi:aryl-alcohol dehydrogenase-like predicted oxidoreductase